MFRALFSGFCSFGKRFAYTTFFCSFFQHLHSRIEAVQESLIADACPAEFHDRILKCFQRFGKFSVCYLGLSAEYFPGPDEAEGEEGSEARRCGDREVFPDRVEEFSDVGKRMR